MPDINNISVPRYQPSQPYHYVYDNLPIDAIVAREDLINTAVDANTAAIAATYGTAGSLAGRLNQSLELNGDLKPAAVNTSLHNIGAHADGSFTVASGELSAYQADYPLVTNPVPFVRMLEAEREKLALIADSATSVSIDFPNASPSPLSFNNGTISFEDSTTITWTSNGGQAVRADVVSSLANAHQHYDNIVPASVSLTPDYQNYYTASPTALVYTSGSLKVYVNGVRLPLNPTPAYYIPSADPLTSWTLNQFAENVGSDGFSLLNPITANDIIVIDFEVPL
jgi:hypothetical protein